ncbi:MAG TPA: class I SAM-dependent methyltransferase [Tepidisphaeraceae bacterium]|jgi:2-polyprenyl-3-methyl-5-hydroxy-6-metoxy-1,4-benzoquinol methylase|nr:class I SAM-dependent methyltransferase [Tepidisphaeraceae bacterium]
MAERMGESSEKALSNVDRWTYGHQSTQAGRDIEAIEQMFKKYEVFYRGLLPGKLPSDREGLILDLPCGEGMMVYSLLRMGYKNVVGYDLDQGRLATGQKLGLPLKYGDIFELLAKQASDSVECVLAMDFLEHLEKPQVVDFLRQVHRVLKPGGRLLARTPCADSPQGNAHIHNDFTHKWAATSGVLCQLFAASGFVNATAFGEHPTWNMSKGYARVPLFKAFTSSVNLALRAAGLMPYQIWSASMWAVGIKGASAGSSGQ